MKSKLKLSPAKSKEVDHIIDVVEKHTGISRKDILGLQPHGTYRGC